MLWFQLYIPQVMPWNLKPEGEWIDKLYIYKAYTSYQLNSIMNHLNLCSATFFLLRTVIFVPIFFIWTLHYLVMVQMVQAVDQLHTDMGIVLFLLHTNGVWLLQGTPRKAVHSRHCWPGCLLDRYFCELFCCISWPRYLPHDLQP